MTSRTDRLLLSRQPDIGLYRNFCSIIISGRKSNINDCPQTFTIFNGEPKEPEKDSDIRRGDDFSVAYPKPNHAKSALAVLVTATPYVSIIGKVPEAIIDIKKERNELN